MVSVSSLNVIDITKAIKEDLSRYYDVLYDAVQILGRRQFAIDPNGKIDIKGLVNEVNKMKGARKRTKTRCA